MAKALYRFAERPTLNVQLKKENAAESSYDGRAERSAVSISGGEFQRKLLLLDVERWTLNVFLIFQFRLHELKIFRINSFGRLMLDLIAYFFMT